MGLRPVLHSPECDFWYLQYYRIALLSKQNHNSRQSHKIKSFTVYLIHKGHSNLVSTSYIFLDSSARHAQEISLVLAQKISIKYWMEKKEQVDINIIEVTQKQFNEDMMLVV